MILPCLVALVVHSEALSLVLTMKMSPSLALNQVPQVVIIIYKLHNSSYYSRYLVFVISLVPGPSSVYIPHKVARERSMVYAPTYMYTRIN